MNKRRITLLAFATIFTMIFISCTGREMSEGSILELRYGFTTEPKTLDPLSMDNTADGRSILFNVFEGLVKPDTDGTFLPCIAESWEIEQGGLIYVFRLRDGVRFHDGSVVNAQDVKFSLDAVIASGTAPFNQIREIIIQSSNEIRVVLESPDPDYLPYMTIGIVKANNMDRERNVIGTGPFYIESYSPQRELVLKKFEDYWQPNPGGLDKVTIVFFANYETLMIAMRAGTIDGANLTGSLIAQLNRNNFDIFDSYSAAVQLLALNNAAPHLSNILVRKALNYGIDIQGIIDAAFFGSGTPSGSPVIPGLSAYYEPHLDYPYDPDYARALLGEAGYNENNRLSLEIAVPSNYVMHVDTAQVIADQLERIGVNTTIRLVDWTTWLDDIYRARNYQATIISLDSSYISARNFLNRYHSGSNSNFINFNNNDFDIVYDSLLTETNARVRNGLYREAQRIITSNAASVFIQDIFFYKVFIKGVYEGVRNYPLYLIDFSSIRGID